MDKSRPLRNSYLLDQFNSLVETTNSEGEQCLDLKGMRRYFVHIHELFQGVESLDQEPLSAELQQKAREVFASIDTDGTMTISKEEAMTKWDDKFSTMSAEEFFDQTDFDNDGMVTFGEFIRFW